MHQNICCNFSVKTETCSDIDKTGLNNAFLNIFGDILNVE